MTRRVFRGVAALVALGLILGAVPYGLARWGSWPITGIPTGHQLRDLPTAVLTDTTVFAVLTVTAWIVWALFAVSVLFEISAVARGVEAPRLPASRTLQHGARHLVAALLMSVAAYRPLPAHAAGTLPVRLASAQSSAVVVDAPPSRGPTVATSTVAPVPVTPPAAAVGQSPPNTTGAAVITVRPGDNAWQLATTYLGDGMRWREIWDLNRDQTQADGTQWTDPQLIRPGWHLTLPANAAASPSISIPAAATAATSSEPTSDATGRSYTVMPGDTLSSIATQQLADPALTFELFERNHDRPQPHGDALTDPDLIRPGWVLDLPDSPAPPAAQPPAPSLPPTPSAMPSVPTSPTAIPPPSSASPAHQPTEPTTTTPRITAPEPSPPTSTTTPAPVPHPLDHPHTAVEDEPTLPASAPLLAGIASATVLATGLALHLLRLRRRRSVRGAQAQAGTAPRMPNDTVRAVIAAANVPLVRWAGQELATLGTRVDLSQMNGAPVAVELSEATGIEVLWAAPHPTAPIPWEATAGGWAWRLRYDPDVPVPADDLPAFIPGLVTIGERDNRQLLVNLEALGSLSVTGDPAAVDAFARAVVWELAADEELADAYVQTAGIMVDGVEHLDRVTSGRFESAVDRVTTTVASVDHALTASGVSSTFEFRAGAKTETHLELFAVVARVANRGEAHALTTASAANRGVAAIILGDAPDAGGRLVLDGDGNGRIEPLGITFRAAGLPPSSATTLVKLLDTENPVLDARNDRNSGPVLVVVPDDLTSFEYDATRLPLNLATNGADAASLARVDDRSTGGWRAPEPRLLVRVLGKPSIPERADLVRRELVLAVYLACKGRPISTSSVQDAVWNGRAVQSKTVWNLVGRTRSKLGVFEDGTAVMPQVDRLQNTLQLAAGVVTDHAVLRSLYERALVVSSTEAVGLLRSGLSLIEGPPFDAAGYDWAHHTEQYVADASALIERSAEHLVELAGNAGDVDLAREAIMFGLRGLPGNEVLYRARMRLEHQAGNLTAVRSAYSALVSFLDELEAEPSSATLELYRQLTGTATR